MIDDNIDYIYNKMLEYQKKHNIIEECITNTMYLIDTIRCNGYIANVKAVIACWADDINSYNRVIIHMVIEYNGYIIDPSYEIKSNNPYYFDNFNLFKNEYKDVMTPDNIKDVITNYIKFIKIAEQINNGEVLVSNKEYYNLQADYIEQTFKSYKSKN